MKGKARQANIESLRIVAMLMVVVLHYLVKGQAAVSLVDNTGVVNVVLWLVKALCIVTINVYVLISGYFFWEAKWRISRLVNLWLQTLCYSIGVPLVCLCLGVGNVAQWSVYDWGVAIFPLQMEHYWFATAYIVLYLLVPILSVAVQKMEKKQLQVTIGVLVLFFSVGKSIIPILIPTDRYGYDFGWFICLFLIAAYIRLYGIQFLNNTRKALIIYLILVVTIFAYSAGLGWLTRSYDLPLSYAMDMVHCYNHILVLGASVALFCGIRYFRIPKGNFSKIVCAVAPYTFGVYLLHENIAIRQLWQSWFGVESVKGSFMFLPHMLITVLVVFVISIIVDYVRSIVFQVVEKLLLRFR